MGYGRNAELYRRWMSAPLPHRLRYPSVLSVSCSWMIADMEYDNPCGTFSVRHCPGDSDGETYEYPEVWLPDENDRWNGVHELVDDCGYSEAGDEHWTLAVDPQTGDVWHMSLERSMDGWSPSRGARQTKHGLRWQGQCLSLTMKSGAQTRLHIDYSAFPQAEVVPL